jgi:hypothetical protein
VHLDTVAFAEYTPGVHSGMIDAEIASCKALGSDIHDGCCCRWCQIVSLCACCLLESFGKIHFG